MQVTHLSTAAWVRTPRFIALIALIATTSANAKEGEFVDPRDGKSYATVKIGAATWFAQHLNFDAPSSHCYDDDPANCAGLGRLYPWEVALAACPPGWHLSTDLDWQLLEFELGMPVDALEEIETRGGNEGAKMEAGGGSGLELARAGYRNPDGSYERKGEVAVLWTSTEADSKNAWHRDIGGGRRESWRSREYKPYGMSVRCVKNTFEPK